MARNGAAIAAVLLSAACSPAAAAALATYAAGATPASGAAGSAHAARAAGSSGSAAGEQVSAAYCSCTGDRQPAADGRIVSGHEVTAARVSEAVPRKEQVLAMQCQFDDSADRRAGTDRQEIVRRILEAIQPTGYPRDRLTAYLALSYRETDIVWLTQRPNADDAQCPCRTSVGLERSSGGAYKMSTRSDPEALAFLAANGLIQPGPAGDRPANSAAEPGGQGVALFFEWVVAHRKAALLDNFSLGPTQMHLYWSALRHPGGRCGFPETWEEVWDFYNSQTYSNVATYLQYMDPPCWTKPSPGAVVMPNRDQVIAWLNGHTGGAHDAHGYSVSEAYYEGAAWKNLPAVPAYKAYKNAIAEARMLADAVGYPYP